MFSLNIISFLFKMIGLNIHLKSFKLNPSIFNANDKIRVSITTFPDGNKEAFVTEAKQMKCVHHFFTVNITEKTERIIFVFRKVGFFENPIIASTIVSSYDFPKSKSSYIDTKSINIYEPIQNSSKDKKRKVFGEMQIELSLTTAFPTFNTKNNSKNSCSYKVQEYSKVNGYSKNNNEKRYCNNSIFSYDNCN